MDLQEATPDGGGTAPAGLERESREREGDTARENGRRYKEETEEGWDWELASSVCACVLEKEKKRGPRGALWMQLPPCR